MSAVRGQGYTGDRQTNTVVCDPTPALMVSRRVRVMAPSVP